MDLGFFLILPWIGCVCVAHTYHCTLVVRENSSIADLQTMTKNVRLTHSIKTPIIFMMSGRYII